MSSAAAAVAAIFIFRRIFPFCSYAALDLVPQHLGALRSKS